MNTPSLPDLLRLSSPGDSFLTMQSDRNAISCAGRLNPPRKVATSRVKLILPGSLTLQPVTLVTVLT